MIAVASMHLESLLGLEFDIQRCRICIALRLDIPDILAYCFFF